MALNLSAASLSQISPSTSAASSQFVFLKPKHKDPLLKLLRHVPSSSSSRAFVQADSAAGNGVSDPPPEQPSSSSSSESVLLSSSRTRLDLLEQLTSAGSASSPNGYESDGAAYYRQSSATTTIRDQLMRLGGDRDDGDDGEFTIKLVGKNLNKVSPKSLTTSQKRNIRRQAYLNEVSRRNDSVFFATIGAFVLLPPLIILGIAVATGYVQLFP